MGFSIGTGRGPLNTRAGGRSSNTALRGQKQVREAEALHQRGGLEASSNDDRQHPSPSINMVKPLTSRHHGLDVDGDRVLLKQR